VKLTLLWFHAYGFIFAATHYLQFLLTGVTPGTSFPEFSAVGQLDGEQGGYYDSTIRTVILKADWVKKSKDTEHWKMMTQRIFEDQQLVMERLGNIMKHFNQTEGVHTVQWVYRCELDDDGSKRGYMQCGYDGEDFLSLDLNSLSWIAPVPQALITKHKWEETGHVRFQKHFLLNECIGWLQKYVEYGRSTLERKVAPEVSLFQKDSSSPVVCHATGFFPKAVMISWQKNGEDLNEGVELRETVPNQDGTFQKRSILTLSPEELNRNQYTCIVQHEGLKKKLQVSDRRVLSVLMFAVFIYLFILFLPKAPASDSAPVQTITPTPLPAPVKILNPTPTLAPVQTPTQALNPVPTLAPTPTPVPTLAPTLPLTTVSRLALNAAPSLDAIAAPC
uniref:Ig-like domain-containing protein n=1 Tax=Astyanax mexicanus TaxID=7994 RepID=A0A3B1JGD3_ASTMX